MAGPGLEASSSPWCPVNITGAVSALEGSWAVLGVVPWFESRNESGLAALRTRCVRQELKDELKSTMGRESFPGGQGKAGSTASRSTAEESHCGWSAEAKVGERNISETVLERQGPRPGWALSEQLGEVDRRITSPFSSIFFLLTYEFTVD